MNHAFASAVIIDNTNVDLASSRRNDSTSNQSHNSRKDVSLSMYLPSDDDFDCLEAKYTVLVAEIVTSTIPFFSQYAYSKDDMRDTYFQNETDYEKVELAAMPIIQHTIAVLPVLMKNEQNYQDVADILDSYEDVIHEVSAKANIDTSNLRVQLSGDQLTRDRFSGAIFLREHHLNDRDRYNHLKPITFGLFHMRMNFLQMVFNRLYKTQSVAEVGTLRNLKEKLGRKQVNDDVKNSFDADSQFLDTVCRAHVVLAALDYFSMNSINDNPKKHILSHEQSREDFVNCIKEIVRIYVTQETCTVVGKG
jgi:hypothetical protein